MRRLDKSAGGEPLKLSEEQYTKLRRWLKEEHQKAIDAHMGIDSTWKQCLRSYYGIPRLDVRNIPYQNAPNLEVTIGALACDGILAQAMDLIFQIRPIVTVRSRMPKYEKATDAIQKYLDWGMNGENRNFKFKKAFKHTLLDTIQLGTGVYYIPWMDTVSKTDLFKVTDRGPEIVSLKPEDFILPVSCTGDIQAAKFCTMRMPMTKADLELRQFQQNWKIEGASASSANDGSIVSLDRFKLAGASGESGSTGSTGAPNNYSIMHTWGRTDIDDDGIEEDLEIIWDWTSGAVFKTLYQQYDVRPFVLVPYQDRAHVPWGLGVMEMVSPFEQEISEIHNQRVANMTLANCRLIAAKEQYFNELEEIWPGKVIHCDDPGSDFRPWQMAEVYPSSAQAEAVTLAFAERRVGVTDLSAPARLGGRTPGMTALSALQQMNRRFTPAFDNIREGAAETVMQCLFRLQEQLKNEKVSKFIEDDLIEILDIDMATELVTFLRSKPNHDIIDCVDIELTASSVSVNREADRQNAVLLGNLYEKYADGLMKLQMVLSNPQIPQNMKQTAQKLLEGTNKIAEKILKTFDQVTDVKQFLVKVDEADSGLSGISDQLQQLMGGMQQQPQPPGQPQGNLPPASEAPPLLQ